MEQIIVTLVMNSLEALPGRDHAVEITTAFNVEPRAVLFEVRDEGAGIPKEHLSHVGEPFLTTKEASGGTGLGLAITSSLVRSHNGTIKFSSEPGKGTRAIVMLPCGSDGRPGGGV
jgi:polar amino acid transport system substrate-binding protein